MVYAFTHLPFGLAPACKVYAEVNHEVYKPLRVHSNCLSFFIDDALLAAATRRASLFQAETVALLFTSMGFFLSWEKCSLASVQ